MGHKLLSICTARYWFVERDVITNTSTGNLIHTKRDSVPPTLLSDPSAEDQQAVLAEDKETTLRDAIKRRRFDTSGVNYAPSLFALSTCSVFLDNIYATYLQEVLEKILAEVTVLMLAG